MDALSFLVWPFLACLLLVLIHAYFGIHILERGIIFVDLALAQFIGIGMALSFLFGGGSKTRACTSLRGDRGVHPLLLQACGPAREHRGLHRRPLRLLLLGGHPDSRSHAARPGGVQDHPERQHPLGHAGRCSFHVRALRRRRAPPGGPLAALPRPVPGRKGGFLLEFLFFGSFAVVLVKSVQMAGILQVFAFLLLPALIGRLFFQEPSKILLAAWLTGIVVTTAGLATVLSASTSPLPPSSWRCWP